MIEYIDAPMPYILGISRILYKTIKQKRRDPIPSDVTIFDLDKNEILSVNSLEPIPFLPPDLTQEIESLLQNIKSESPKLKNREFWLTQTLKIKNVFLKFFLTLIGNFTLFYNKIQETDFTSQMEDCPASKIFDSQKYIKSHEIQMQQLYKELCRTQHFTSFIEKVYKIKTQGKIINDFGNELDLFLEGTKLYSKKCEKSFVENLKKNNDLILHKYRNVFFQEMIL